MVAALSDSDEGIANVFSKKIAQSSDEDIVTAKYVGSASDPSSPFEVEVRSLATPQVNLGNYLDPDQSELLSGSYSFSLNTTLNSYEFQFNVNDGDTNQNVLTKLKRLINNAGIGLKADIISDDENNCALKITSQQTGLPDSGSHLFEVLPTPDAESMRAIRTLGINNVEQPAGNASYIIDGKEYSSSTNTVTYDKSFELKFKGTNQEGETTSIGFKTNSDAIADNVESLVGVYNNIISLGIDHAEKEHSNQLLKDMESVAHLYHNELEAIGLSEESDGSIKIDRSLLSDAVTAEDADDCFNILNEFKDALGAKAVAVSINPMRYVSKIMVAYKDPSGHNFNAPYATSPYSGMMMDTFL
jgi:flagellar hook-associated protein 2